MDRIKWAEIEAECGDYRSGFVATFKKYEGKPTDEKDKQGRTVKVTMKSFARHVGIDERTFQRWVKKQEGHLATGAAGYEVGSEGAERAERSHARKALAKEKQRQQVLHELDTADLLQVTIDAEEAFEEAMEDASVEAEEAARQRQEEARRNRIGKPGKHRTRKPGPEPRVEDELDQVARLAGKANFLMWKIMEELDDLPPVQGEPQIWRLARFDYARDGGDLLMRMAAAGRKMVETDEMDEALMAELQTELDKLGKPVPAAEEE